MTGNQMQATIFKTSLLAGIAGAGIALLLAPKSGSETRQKLREAAAKMNQRMDRAGSKAEETITEASQAASNTADDLKNKVAETKATANRAMNKDDERK